MSNKWIWRLASLGVAAGFIGLWQLIADLRLVSPIYLPSAAQTFAALSKGLASGDLLTGLIQTVERMFYGWFVASLLGIGVGAFIGVSAAARRYLQPMLEFLRPLPPAALIPLAIALFGLTDGMVLLVIGFAALWPMLIATIHGFSTIEPRLQDTARMLRLTKLQVIFKIALPNALPDVLAGMRLSLTYALILAIVGEMLAGRDGLGSFILHASRSFRASELYAGVLLLGVVGLLVATLLSMAERFLLQWRQNNQSH